MNKLSLCALGLAASAALLPTVSQAYVDLLPTEDGVYYYDRIPGSTYRWWDYSPPQNSAHYYYYYDPGWGASVQRYDTHLWFDLTGVDRAKLKSATLYIDIFSASGDSAAWVSIGGVGNLLTRPLGWNAFDLTSQMASWGNSIELVTDLGDPNYAGVDVAFGSDVGGPGVSPYLRLDFIPEPSSVWLLGIASVSLLALGRKYRTPV